MVHRCATPTFATDEVSTKFGAEDVRAEELFWAERQHLFQKSDAYIDSFQSQI